MDTDKLVTIFGGSGFVGRYIARRMAKQGWRVRVAVRRPNDAIFVRTYGVVGQVEPVLANIRDEESVASAVLGATAVVNSVGILAPSGKQTFDAIQAEGAGRIARAAADAGAGRFLHVSAIGADATSDSAYARTKAEGERLVTEAFPNAVILRPSIVFGIEDQFFNRFAGMARLSPALPVIGPETQFQPVFVDDVAAAAEVALAADTAAGIYELGGPEVASFRALMQKMLGVIRRRRAIVALPFWLAQIQGRAFDLAARASGGLLTPPLTLDQVKLLARDNVVGADARGFADLGLTATSMDAVLDEYLYAYRPYGQYSEITETAKHLRE
ncbi:MAG: complex I NDUFA9 subunit family protein [Pseudomonadota bacterium]